jgi:asparagine synthase (glutamine-hydrolysing)
VSDSKCLELRNVLTASVKRNLASTVLLSGGLDSSILACIASKFIDLTGITVTYNNAPDLRYAQIMAQKYSIKHLIKHLTIADLNGAIESVIKIMQSFDPMEVRNTAVIYSSINMLKQNGFSSVMTGDGGDELFVGYNYLLRLEEGNLEEELNKLWAIMHFSSIVIGKELGVSVKSPYLDHEFIEFAKKIPISLKVKEYNNTRWGKWILRSCFQDDITAEIAWRTKMPLEQGAGTSALTQHFNSSVSNDDFNSKTKRYAQQDSVKIRDKEHLHYYEVYRKFFDAPKESYCEARCPDCQGCVRKDSRFCRTCGAFPIKPIY